MGEALYSFGSHNYNIQSSETSPNHNSIEVENNYNRPSYDITQGRDDRVTPNTYTSNYAETFTYNANYNSGDYGPTYQYNSTKEQREYNGGQMQFGYR